MENRLPTKARALADKADVMAIGANEFGGSIPLTIVTPTAFVARISPVTNAIMAADSAKVELTNRRSALRTLIGTARLFLTHARDHLKFTFGTRHDPTKWDVAGFVGSLEVPLKQSDVAQLLQGMKSYLASNAGMELASKGITAAAAQALLAEIQTARGAVNQQKKLVDDLLADRDTKANGLRKAMRNMIAELKARLTPSDSRWLAFGLNKPGAKATPDVPANVTVVLVGPTSASVKWDQSARAEYYHVWMRVVGGDPDWQRVGSPADIDFELQKLLHNPKTEVAVSAVNSGGESALSAIAAITWPEEG